MKKGKIIRTILPKNSEEEALIEITKYINNYIPSNYYNAMAKEIGQIYLGRPSSFEDEEYILESDDFQEKVLLEVYKIPYGEIRTYKQIAEAINSKAYRAVGSAIGKNPLPLIIPCHRVVKSDLSIGEFYGGKEMKKEILQNEGIEILKNRVLM